MDEKNLGQCFTSMKRNRTSLDYDYHFIGKQSSPSRVTNQRLELIWSFEFKCWFPYF